MDIPMSVSVIVFFATLLFFIIAIPVYIDEYKENKSIRNYAKAKTEAFSYEESLKWREKIKAESDAFEKAEMEILSTDSDGRVIGKKGNRMFVGYNHQMVRSPHCNYCGSKNVSNGSNCTQCGAPVW